MALPSWDPELLAMLMTPDSAPTSLLERVARSRPAWMDDAACLGRPDVTFVPSCESVTATAAAVEVCAGCPAKGPCLDYAMADDSLVGVWAGTTTAERRELRRAVA